ncbi:AAA family ATPase [Streptomyces sp. MOE7]|uniref:AAA family ATPase n=1 Tax=Streptomyces sp. MOE7 TaxID=1961713 RepID=UPI001F19E9EB|nr:AAA family ATPase [Streptomyces sp. MOE7]
MTPPRMPSAQQQADNATRAVLEQLPSLAHRGLVVKAPPGAGKTTLVAQAAATLARSSSPCPVIAQTNSQADHLVRRFTDDHPHLLIARFTGVDHAAPHDLQAHSGIRVGTRIEDLERTADVIVGTAMKWATVTDRRWPWGVIDEAYQMRSDILLRTAHLFDQALFVGDPGQLDPFSTAKSARFADMAHDPMNSAVAVALANNPDLPVHSLPVSWRLPPSAIP